LTSGTINDVASAIQLALAPAFLLVSIAGMLNVMAGRLARIIDRARRLTEGHIESARISRDSILVELRSLERRRQLASAAITACTLAALLVCTIIPTLFLEVMLEAHLKWTIVALFTAATLAFVAGLALFLREVHLAISTIRIHIPENIEGKHD